MRDVSLVPWQWKVRNRFMAPSPVSGHSVLPNTSLLAAILHLDWLLGVVVDIIQSLVTT